MTTYTIIVHNAQGASEQHTAESIEACKQWLTDTWSDVESLDAKILTDGTEDWSSPSALRTTMDRRAGDVVAVKVRGTADTWADDEQRALELAAEAAS